MANGVEGVGGYGSVHVLFFLFLILGEMIFFSGKVGEGTFFFFFFYLGQTK